MSETEYHGVPDGEELAGKLQSVLSDPEQMGKLMQMASALSASGIFGGGETGMSEGEQRDEPTARDDAPRKKEAHKDVSSVPHEKGNTGVGSQKHMALLCALKPYMKPEKQERIDQMLRLLRVAEAAEAMLRQ